MKTPNQKSSGAARRVTSAFAWLRKDKPFALPLEHGKAARRGLTRPTLAALLLLMPGLVGSLDAQGYSINWYKVAGGGGMSTNSQYSFSGTIGQQDASLQPMAGGGYSLTGGFWALYAVQTPGAPTLSIARSGTMVTVYWQNTSGWSLQQNNNLSMPGGWAASGGVTTSNGTNYLSLPNPTGKLFFRLTGP